MSIFRLNKFFLIELIISRFDNNKLEFKYQNLDQINLLNLNNNL